jgi:DNA polymerase-1
MKRLFLIDANSLIHRAFHALPPLTAPDGQPSQALYGLSRMLSRLLKEEHPEYVAALFDRPEPTHRDELYKEYKAGRPETPSELISQLIEAHNLFKAFGIKTFEKPGFEADDLIATLAEKFKKEKSLQIIILSGDRDGIQLVEGEKIVLWTPIKGISEIFVYDEKSTEEKFGIRPKQMTDYKALVGDSSDNIKGVAGIGPKTAAMLLNNYGSLDVIFTTKDEGPAVLKVKNGRKDAEFSRELVSLRKDAPLDVSLEDLAVVGESPAEYFEKMGFSSLATRDKAKKEEKKESQKSLF